MPDAIRAVIYVGGDNPDPDTQRRRCLAHVQARGYTLVAIAEDLPGERRRWKDVRRMLKAGDANLVVVVGPHVIPAPRWIDPAGELEEAHRTRRVR